MGIFHFSIKNNNGDCHGQQIVLAMTIDLFFLRVVKFFDFLAQ